MSPSMRYRLSLDFPLFDIRKSIIRIFWDMDAPGVAGNRFVVVRKVLTPEEIARFDDDWKAYWQYRNEEATEAFLKAAANDAWTTKYGEPVPESALEDWLDPETTPASCLLPYDGTISLTKEESSAIAAVDGDLTMDMVWLVVEGLGWRPGKPVPLDDPGWRAIWAEEEECCMYIHIVRELLGMPFGKDFCDEAAWKPLAVTMAEDEGNTREPACL
ncbi:hypothetical protein [Acidithiobacillus ferrooxidans]|uniref:hypothetical protein n=1 Tax=Acidithiobacillus ferrooxidans TaxID=920 RepID=UPI000A9B48CF|nr:hypothetical protein [Acidithiobacillus ferrooxidans]